jgi:hypothetical protein
MYAVVSRADHAVVRSVNSLALHLIAAFGNAVCTGQTDRMLRFAEA